MTHETPGCVSAAWLINNNISFTIMKKKLLLFGLIALLSLSCGENSIEVPEESVMINGVKWATRNVAKPGTFAAKPENAGMFYQWNRKAARPVTGDVTGWDSSTPAGMVWEKDNDPCPAGYHVPTFEQLETLRDFDKVSLVWASMNGIYGLYLIDIDSRNSVFLPAAGYRSGNNGMLYLGAGKHGLYWSSAQYNATDGYCLAFNSTSESAFWINNLRSCAHSIRCVAD